MRSRVVLFILGIIFLFNLQAAHAHIGKADAGIRNHFPDLKIDAIEETPIGGLYEITIKDDVLYYHPDSGITLFGEMWSKEKKNLTAGRKAAIKAAKIKNIPLDKAIKIGNGPHTVIEIVDPDCPYCRKTHAFFKKREDLTRYVFLYPLVRIHPEAERKSLAILCAKDRKKAYEAVLSGSLDDVPFKNCDDGGVTTLLDEHKQIGRRLGVRGTPALWINGVFVSGADFKTISRLLDEHP
ncbi:MAG: DsbC family protein [Nitrospiria bacterium]